MDAEGRVIPIVEDDQGEGWKDPWEERDKLEKKLEKLQHKLARQKHSKRK